MKGIKKDQQDIDLWSAGDALVLKALGIVPAKLAPEVFNPGAGNHGLLSTFLTVPDCFPHYDTVPSLHPSDFDTYVCEDKAFSLELAALGPTPLARESGGRKNE
jgi:hypothetical protein